MKIMKVIMKMKESNENNEMIIIIIIIIIMYNEIKCENNKIMK